MKSINIVSEGEMHMCTILKTYQQLNTDFLSLVSITELLKKYADTSSKIYKHNIPTGVNNTFYLKYGVHEVIFFMKKKYFSYDCIHYEIH